MNNLRLLAGVLCAALSGGSVCANEPTVLTLEEIFASAEANSAQLKPFKTAVEEAEKEIKVAKVGKLPEINADISLSYIGNGFTTERNFSDYSVAEIPHFGNIATITVRQPLYTGGAITKNIEMAHLKRTSSRLLSEQEQNNVRFRLARFYLDLYKYSNLRKVIENNIVLAREMLAEMQARFEQGIALSNDLTRYELLISDLELQLTRVDNTITILNANLVEIAGLPSGTKVIPDSTIIDRVLPMNEEFTWQQEAKANAPALKLAGNGVDISRKTEELVKSDMLPKIGLEAMWTLNGPILVEVPPINRNLSYWYVGLGVSYNLSSLYKTNKSLARSKAATVRAREEFEATRENVSLAVKADYIRYLEAYEELKSRTKSVELAERNYDITSTRYSSDMALITDMIDAANSRLEAQQQLVNARINIIFYYYKLLFTTGKI